MQGPAWRLIQDGEQLAAGKVRMTLQNRLGRPVVFGAFADPRPSSPEPPPRREGCKVGAGFGPELPPLLYRLQPRLLRPGPQPGPRSPLSPTRNPVSKRHLSRLTTSEDFVAQRRAAPALVHGKRRRRWYSGSAST